MAKRHPLFERCGTFTIQRDDLEALPDWLQQLMARVIIVRADSDFMRDGISYTALSPEFEKTNPQCVPPRYGPVVEDGRFLRWANPYDAVSA